jgi:rfaE bifunctional protein kinase chain/domain
LSIRKRLHEIVDGMRGVPMGVVGDLVADVYVHARPYKLSREAPVVIARHEDELAVPGGGANVIANLAALGAGVRASGRVGLDDMGRRLLEDLVSRGVDVSGVLRVGATTTLTRYMVGMPNTRRQQVLRIDRVPDPATFDAPELELDGECRGWIASDYGYGAVTGGICDRLRELAAAGVPVVADARARLERFAGVTLAKPNLQEAEAQVQRALEGFEEVRDAAHQLKDELRFGAVLVTMGNRGMVLVDGGSDADLVLEAVGAREAVDVSGAGDTVSALMALALAAGATRAEAAVLANRGAGVVVMHEGTTPLSAAELHAAIDSGGPEAVETDLADLRKRQEAGHG